MVNSRTLRPDVKATHNMSGQRRAQFGCMMTFENDQGDTLTLHAIGAPLKMVPKLCDYALTRDGSNRVVSYSTPETILTDLSCSRMMEVDFTGRLRTFVRPEDHVLKRCDRGHLLHPRLKRTDLR